MHTLRPACQMPQSSQDVSRSRASNILDEKDFPPLPPPAHAPPSPKPSQAGSEASDLPPPKVTTPHKNIAVFKHFVRVTIGGAKRQFANKDWGNLELTVMAAEEFRKGAERLLMYTEPKLYKATERVDMMTKHNFVQSKTKCTLAELRLELAEHFASKKSAELETGVLKHMWKSLLIDDADCDIQPAKSGFTVTLKHEANRLEHTVASFEKAVQWVKSMRASLAKDQKCARVFLRLILSFFLSLSIYIKKCIYIYVCEDAKLNKTILQLYSQGKAAVEAQEKLAKLAETTGCIKDIAMSAGNDPCITDTCDVTQQFLDPAVLHGPNMCISATSVYAGLLKKLCHREQGHFRYGLCGGDSQEVIDVVLSGSIEDALQSNELAERWNGLGYRVTGLAVWVDQSNMPPSEHASSLSSIFAKWTPSTLLLMLFNGTDSPESYDCEVGDSGQIEFKPVGLKKMSTRHKKVEYAVVPLNKLGVSFQDEATFLVQRAIHAQVDAHTGVEVAQTEARYRILTPPDGLCFFHAVLGALQWVQYTKIPRKNGFAVNPRQEEMESEAAKNLMQIVIEGLEKQPDRPDFQRCLKNLKQTNYLDFFNVAAAAEILGLRIRITMQEKAWEWCGAKNAPRDILFKFGSGDCIHLYFQWKKPTVGKIFYSHWDFLLPSKVGKTDEMVLVPKTVAERTEPLAYADEDCFHLRTSVVYKNL